MKRAVSTALAVALLLGLGALAVLALPGAYSALAPTASAAAPGAFQSMAPAVTAGIARYNVIGMPLGAAAQFASLGLGFDADGLADLIGPSVTQILRWNASRQDFDSWDPVNNDGYANGNPITSPFQLTVGEAYWVLVDSAAPDVVSFVGDVPLAGSVKFTLVGASAGCAYNQVTIPLEQSGLSDADLLADSISLAEVAQVLRWNAVRQDFDSWDPANNEGYVGGDPVTTPWAVRLGYPYMVCLNAGVNGHTWPQ